MSYSLINEAFFFALIALVLATTYSRLRYFDLTAGFWAVVVPHLIHGMQRPDSYGLESSARLSFSDPWVLGLLLIFVIQVGSSIVFAGAFARRRELYTLLSFFLSIAIGAIAALGILPSSGSTLPFESTTGTNILIIVAVVTMFGAMLLLNKDTARLLFLPGIKKPSVKERSITGLVVTGQIIAWSLIGCLITAGHKGVLAKGELVSIFCIAAVAAVRPKDAKTICLASVIAGSLIVVADLVVKPAFEWLSQIQGVTHIALDPRPSMLAIFMFVIIARQLHLGQQQLETAELPKLLSNPNVRHTLISALVVFSLVLYIQFTQVHHIGKVSNGLVLLTFGILTALIYTLYSVITISLPTLAFVLLNSIFLILSQSTSTPEIPVLISVLMIFTASAVFSIYLSFLRRQDRAFAILIDLVVTFSVSTFAMSIISFSGEEDFLSFSNNPYFALPQTAAVFGLLGTTMFILLTTLVFYKIRGGNIVRAITHNDSREDHNNRLGGRDVYANLLSLTNPLTSSLHGFRSWVHLFWFAFLITSFALIVAYFQSARNLGMGHADYGLIAGLQVLAVAFASFGRRSHIGPIALSIIFTALMFTPVMNGGVRFQLFSAFLGTILILIMTKIEKFKHNKEKRHD